MRGDLAPLAKPIPDMIAEVREWCQAKGWYDKPVSFREATGLLHTEAGEATDAWRQWGLDDATGPRCTHGDDCAACRDRIPKPEGVGSEFADIMIRLLDDAGRFDVDLDHESLFFFSRQIEVSESFIENMDTLHILISRASEMRQGLRPGKWQSQLGGILVFLQELSARYGIDLCGEYERKMAYNRTRAYRHGKRQ